MHPPRPPAGKRFVIAVGCVVAASFSSPLPAVAGDVEVETILSDLKAPCGVALRPDVAGGACGVFVAERGAGKVIQVNRDKPGASAAAISGFPVGAASSGGAPCAPGVQSLFFLDHARLVAAGGDADGKPLLRLYDLTESDSALNADEHKQDLELPSNGDKSNPPLLCFHDLARTQPNDRVADMLVMAASTVRGTAGLWKVPVRANTLGDAAAFSTAKVDAKSGAAGGIAVGNNGYIVIAGRSESNSEAASSLKYVNPIDGRVVMAMEIKLPRIVALAYHPTSRNLYAASLAGSNWSGGIYRIDDASEPGKSAGNVVKVNDAARPTALAFSPQGALYVTALGGDDKASKDSGTLLRISGDL